MEELLFHWCGKTSGSSVAAAGAPKDGKKPMFQKQDADGNGAITASECISFWTVQFSEADANKDNKITWDEHVERLKRAFMEMDENHDGYISVNEYRAYWVGKDQIKSR